MSQTGEPEHSTRRRHVFETSHSNNHVLNGYNFEGACPKDDIAGLRGVRQCPAVSGSVRQCPAVSG
eukprot:4508105-Alexandrium_andersonii.AAC.1